jgi:hypothetical protein
MASSNKTARDAVRVPLKDDGQTTGIGYDTDGGPGPGLGEGVDAGMGVKKRAAADAAAIKIADAGRRDAGTVPAGDRGVAIVLLETGHVVVRGAPPSRPAKPILQRRTWN